MSGANRAGRKLLKALKMTRSVRCIGSLCLSLFIFLAAGPSTAGMRTPNFWSPASFSKLPPTISSALTKEGCRIPQATIERKIVATNVISGEFAQKGQRDWAILCSKNGHLYIKVLWGGAAHCPSRIEKERSIPEDYAAQGLEFNHALSIANKDFILQHYQAHGGPKPPTITHFGINYEYLGKASVVHYCHNNKWLELTGSD